MRMAVKFYRDSENPNGYPPLWPKESRIVSNDAPIPPGFVAMTFEEYRLHTDQYRKEADAISASLKEQRETAYKQVLAAACGQPRMGLAEAMRFGAAAAGGGGIVYALAQLV